jgi:hypothetical protein
MKLATVLIIIAANQGYWFGGREGTVALREAVRGGLPAADLVWELDYEGVRLAAGKVALDPNGQTTVRMTPPTTRARITLRWKYRLIAHDSGKEIEHGEIPLHVFPTDLLAGASQHLGNTPLVVWDEPSGLPKILDRAGVHSARVESADQLQVMRPKVLLVGLGAIGDSPFAQAPLLALARAGTSVMIFRQNGPPTLLGYDLATRDVPRALEWRSDHPLLNDFRADDLQSWLKDARTLSVVRLPADEPALEIGFYPREVPGDQPAPIDAVLLTQSVGAGRIVLCQLPLGDWESDPRSQLLLRNAFDYLLTPPQPTPRPSERPTTQPVAPVAVPTIPLSPGDHP